MKNERPIFSDATGLGLVKLTMARPDIYFLGYKIIKTIVYFLEVHQTKILNHALTNKNKKSNAKMVVQ